MSHVRPVFCRPLSNVRPVFYRPLSHVLPVHESRSASVRPPQHTVRSSPNALLRAESVPFGFCDRLRQSAEDPFPSRPGHFLSAALTLNTPRRPPPIRIPGLWQPPPHAENCCPRPIPLQFTTNSRLHLSSHPAYPPADAPTPRPAPRLRSLCRPNQLPGTAG